MFWSYKFTSKSWFKQKKFKAYIKWIIKIVKFDDIEIEKYKFNQHKSPILIYNIDINEIVLSNKISFGENIFKYFILKKLDLYAYYFQKWVHRKRFW